jgi:hypothetical protein
VTKPLTDEQRAVLARIPQRTEAVRRRTHRLRGLGTSRSVKYPTRVEIPCTHEDREVFAREAKRLKITAPELFAVLMADLRSDEEERGSTAPIACARPPP